MKTIYYFYHLNQIGGIETFFYQLGLKYYDRDIIIYYRTADQKQLERLQEYFECRQYHEEIIDCEQAIFNFNLDIIDHVNAKEYTLVLHGDYKDMIKRGQIQGVPNHPKITRWIAVSKLVANSYYELTGIMPEVCYNPYTPQYLGERPIIFISTTRLSIEKGFSRMKKFAEALEERRINYLWFIFTNSSQEYISSNVIYLQPRLDMEKIIEIADFLIQFSDNEGSGYSPEEALAHGIPVIVTPCPVFKELGFNENNSIYLEFDCSNVHQVIDTIISKKFKFSYKPKKDSWDKILLPSKSNYYKDYHKRFEVKATNKYHETNNSDAELHYIPNEGQTWVTSYTRAKYLNELGYVEIIKEVKNEKSINNNSSL